MAAVALTMDQTLDQAGELGSAPTAAVEIRQIADNPFSSLKDLEKAVSLDPMLAARILKFANSAQYGKARTVTDLTEACVALGMRSVRDIAIGMALAGQAAAVLGDEADAYLEHSLAAAAVGQSLEPRGTRANDAFISGLLHDIGILVFLAVHGDEYKKLLEMFPAPDERLCQAERLQYGFDHTALGGACLDRWAIPGRVVHVVRAHHTPYNRDPAVHALKFADELGDLVLLERNDNLVIEKAMKLASAQAYGINEARLRARLVVIRNVLKAFRF